MLRHDDVCMNYEAILGTCFFQDIDKPVSAFHCTQDGLTLVAATSDEMKILRSVIAMKVRVTGSA